MQNDDFSNDNDKKNWFPDEGWIDVEIASMKEAISKAGFSKYTVELVSASNAGEGLIQDLTNIQGKRWLLRQLIEACGIEPQIKIVEEHENEYGAIIKKEEKKIYDWEIENIIGKTVRGLVAHEQGDDWIDTKNNLQKGKLKAKFIQFKKMSV